MEEVDQEVAGTPGRRNQLARDSHVEGPHDTLVLSSVKSPPVLGCTLDVKACDAYMR